MTLIEIQEIYITRALAAHARVTPRTKGNRFGRSIKSARKEAVTRLLRQGWSEKDAWCIIHDAHDMFLLEAAAQD